MYKFIKILGKKSVTFLIILSFISSTFYIPIFTPTPKVDASWPVIDIKQLVQWLMDNIGMIIAQALIDQMVNETIEWANSGFAGNPAYATDPKQFFTDIADGVAGELIDKELALDGLLCSPFEIQIRLGLANYHAPERRYQCTLSESIDNISGALDKGSWQDWFEITQNPANNPYGAYLEAQVDLDKRLASRLGLEKEQLSWNSGFLSWSECEKEDPDTKECLKRGPVQTPGTTIKAGLDEVLPTEMKKLVSAERLDQVIGAVAVGLLKKFIFSQDGLFSNNTSANLNSPSDLVGAPLTLEDALGGADECALLTNIGLSCNELLVTASSTGFGTGTGTGSGGGGIIPGGANDPCGGGYVYNPATRYCEIPETQPDLTPDSNGCIGTGCTPCTGSNCGLGKTPYPDPSLGSYTSVNGVYVGTCLIQIVASYHTSVRMTEDQCAQVNQIIDDGMTFGINSAGRRYALGGGRRSDAIEAIALVCGGDGDSVYICGFP